MKKNITITMIFISSFIYATNELDGKSYCRQIKGCLGNPYAIIDHCISFAEGSAVDSARTFFGNPPPAPIEYKIEGNVIIFGDNKYEISDDGNMITAINASSIAGTRFTLQEQNYDIVE